MPRRTRAESEATAAAVLGAAVHLFGRDGYAEVRLDDVAAAAGVTRGAVYHHYADKTGLFTAVVAQVQRQVGDQVAAAADAVADPWEALVVGCHAFLAATSDEGHRRILLVDAPAVVGWATWRRQDAEHAGRHLDEALAELDAAGVLDVASLGAVAALLSGAMNEASLWVAEQDRPDALAEASAALDRLLGSIRRAGRPRSR